MNNEQQQRIAEIEARQPSRAEWQYGKDIQFLLSIVKGQEADYARPTGWVSAGQRADPRRVYIDFENRECAEAFIRGIEPASGPMKAATSACVEKVKSIAAKYEREQFAEAGNQRIVEKTRLDTANEIIKELESVSIQEQKK